MSDEGPPHAETHLSEQEREHFEWWRQAIIPAAREAYFLRIVSVAHSFGIDPGVFKPEVLRSMAIDALQMAALFVPPPVDVPNQIANKIVDAVVESVKTVPERVDYAEHLVLASQLTLIPHLQILASKQKGQVTVDQCYAQARAILLTYNQRLLNLQLSPEMVELLTDRVLNWLRTH